MGFRSRTRRSWHQHQRARFREDAETSLRSGGGAMSRVEAIAIALRVAAIFLSLLGIYGLFAALALVGGSPDLYAAVVPVTLLGLGVFTWIFSVALARRILPEPDPGT